MNDTSKAKAIRNYAFLKIFADNHSLDAQELSFIERLALEDREVDAEERAALTAIFTKAELLGVSDDVRAEMDRFKKRHGIA